MGQPSIVPPSLGKMSTSCLAIFLHGPTIHGFGNTVHRDTIRSRFPNRI